MIWLLLVILTVVGGVAAVGIAVNERRKAQSGEWVEETVFAAKRAEILHRFLARERIYQTDLFFHRMEAEARANLWASVQRLGKGS